MALVSRCSRTLMESSSSVTAASCSPSVYSTCIAAVDSSCSRAQSMCTLCSALTSPYSSRKWPDDDEDTELDEDELK